MKIIIEFEIGNAAFEDDFLFAIDHILDHAKQRILSNTDECRRPDLGDRMRKNLGKLKDLNGNTVGEVALSD